MEESATLSRLATYKDVGALLIKYVPKLSSESTKVEQELAGGRKVEVSDDAEELANDLESLGPTFVKIGQLLSTRSDLLPAGWLKPLQRLQDDLEPVPFSEIREEVETQLGAKIDRLFDRFDEQPIACASLGQVHRARLRSDGPEVVVKVQRPGVREQVTTELEALQKAADFATRHSKVARRYDIDRMASQFRKAILDELDYCSEATNLTRLARNLRDIPEIEVPAPVRDYCSSTVLTMEFVEGFKVTDLSGVVKTELDGELLAEQMFRAYLQQVLVDGFFHADPHPGNVLLTPRHKLALIDLGMVGHISDRLREHLLRLLSAVSEGRSDEAAKAAIEMGQPRPGFNREEFSAAMGELIEARQSTRVADLQVGQLVMKVTEIAGKHRLRIPEGLFMIGKVLLNLDLIGKELAPDFDPDACLRRQLSDLARQRLNDEFSLGNIIHHFSDIRELVTEMPGRINRTLDKISNDRLSIDVNAIDEAKLLRGFHRVANRITVGVILAAVIIGASLMMRIESDFTLFGYPGIAMIFFLIAAIGGLIIVGRIVFEKEES